MLISILGGRIIPGFTRNWLTKIRPEIAPLAPPRTIREPLLSEATQKITARLDAVERRRR